AWALPEDLAPLEHAIDQMCEGEAEAIAFTSGTQVEHLLEVAEQRGARDRLLQALRARMLVTSIGPVTSEALRAQGIPVDLEPTHPKMGHLAKAIAERGLPLLERKLERA